MTIKINFPSSRKNNVHQSSFAVHSKHWLYRSKHLLLLILLLPFLLSACGLDILDGSGDVISESREVSDFNRVVFGGVGELQLTQGDQESLTVTADDNLLE